MKFAKGIVVVSAIALAGTMAAATLAYAASSPSAKSSNSGSIRRL